MKNFLANSLLKTVVIPLIGGFFYAVGFPLANEGSFFLGSTIGLTFLFSSLSFFKNQANWKKDFLTIFIFSIGYSQLGYYWLSYTLNEFGGIIPPFNYLMTLPFGLFITPHYFIFIGIGYLLLKIPNKQLRLLLAAIFITLLEYITPQQFPSHAGHPWLQLSPFLGLTPFFGAIIYSFITFGLAIFFSQIFITKKKHYLFLILPFLLIIIGACFPIQKINNSKNIQIRLVQANIGNNVKISSISGNMGAREFVYKTYHKLSSNKKPIDLIIWPETAYPFLLSTETLQNAPLSIPTLFKDILRDTQASIFFGGYDIVPRGEDFYFEDQYNTTFLLQPDLSLQNYYHKRKLIPFGETLPLGFLKKPVSQFIKNISYFASGTRYPLFEISNMKFISAICYEILFTSYIRDYLNSVAEQPNFLINVTNDSWYGKTSEPYQHLFLAKWRALEFNIPIVRMTNTGISSILYPDGSESDRIPIFKRAYLDLKLHAPNRSATIYQRLGILPICSLWLFLIIGVIWMRKIPLLKDHGDE